MSHDRPADTRDPVWRRARRLARRRIGLVAVVLALAIAVPGWGLAGPGLAGLSVGIARRADAPFDRSTSGNDDLRDDILALAGHGLALAAEDGALTSARPVMADRNAILVAAEAEVRVGASDVPPVALRAYMRAERVLAMSDPECGLHWWLLAAIGRVESDHGRYQGVVLREDGFGSRPIRGVALDGQGHVARVADTDDGTMDGDPRVDRAVGPMQFIPATWKRVGVDADGDGERNADNIFDAATGAGVYLCTGDVDLANPAHLRAALLRYNPSDGYVELVIRIAEAYENGEGVGRLSLAYGNPEWRGGWDPRSRIRGLGFDAEVEVPRVGPAPLLPANPAYPPGASTAPRGPSAGASGPPPSGPPAAPSTTTTTVPSRPTSPSAPAAPTGPPTDPTQPTDPTLPPTQPTDPSRPTEPAGPTEPTGPPEPVGPDQPDDPDAPECPPGTTTTTTTTLPSTTSSTTTTSTTTTTTTGPTGTTGTTTTTVPGQAPAPCDGSTSTSPPATEPVPAPAEAPDGGAPAPTGAGVPLLAVLAGSPTLRRRQDRVR